MKPKHTAEALLPILLTYPLISRDEVKSKAESFQMMVKTIDPQAIMLEGHLHNETPSLFLARASYGIQISSSGAFYPATKAWANW